MIFLDRPITGQCRRKSIPILMWDYVSGKRNERYIKYEYFEFGPLELPRVRQGFLARPCEPPSPAESADSPIATSGLPVIQVQSLGQTKGHRSGNAISDAVAGQ